MIFGHWFYRRRFSKNWPKLSQNYPYFHKKWGSTLMFTNLVGVHPRNIHKEFKANPCSGLREEVEKIKKSSHRRRRRTQPDRKSHTHSLSVTKKSCSDHYES